MPFWSTNEEEVPEYEVQARADFYYTLRPMNGRASRIHPEWRSASEISAILGTTEWTTGDRFQVIEGRMTRTP